MARRLKARPTVEKYLDRVNREIYPNLIDAAEEWVSEGWGVAYITPQMLATSILNQALDKDTSPEAREQMLVVAQNILNFAYREDWVEKPLPGSDNNAKRED